MNTGNPDIDNSTADYIVGSDECGYGCWAGPLVVCAAVISKDWPHASEVRDSKAFTGKNGEAKREAVARKILDKVVFSLVSIPVEEIDKNGVYKMLLIAHGRAITQAIAKHAAMGCVGSYLVIVDGKLDISYQFGEETRQATALVEADALVPAVSAASIIGKTARDAHMRKLAPKYPGFGFERHKGYGSPEHKEALRTLGICEIHRKSFGPIAERITKEDEPKGLWAAFDDDEE